MYKYEQKLIKHISNIKEIKTNHTYPGEYFDFVFLCGKERSAGDNRSLLEKYINRKKQMRALYSEELHEFLDKMDLLTFEELLFELSTALIIIVESFGSACELGAFSYLNENISKLFIINDKNFKLEKSFITQGPLAKIQKLSKKEGVKRVFYEEFKEELGEKKLIISDDIFKMINNDIKPRKNINKKAFVINDKKMILHDARYLLWFLFDLIKTYGTIRVNNVINILKNTFNVEKIEYESSTKNDTLVDDDFYYLSLFTLRMLEKFNLIKKIKDNYIINYEYIKNQQIDIHKLPSVIFKGKFARKLTTYKDISKIINKAKKEGFIIWKQSYKI